MRKIDYEKSLLNEVDRMYKANDLIPTPKTLYEYLLGSVYIKSELEGIIIGPRTLDQLTASLEYIFELDKRSSYPCSPVYPV